MIRILVILVILSIQACSSSNFERGTEMCDSIPMLHKIRSIELENQIVSYWKENSLQAAKRGVIKVSFEASQDTSNFYDHDNIIATGNSVNASCF